MTEEARPFSVQVERSIAERAASGDSSAVAELYDAYERQLYGYCQRICRNPEDAADATQDAFCSVIQRLPGLDTANLNFAAYLFTTARNACMDIIKQRGRAEPTDEVPEDPFATAAIDTDPERQLLTGDQQRAAREASDRLPETQRTVLALREVSELSYDEIAETMGMKPNAVAQLISRARLNFYKQLRSGAVVIAPLDEAAQRAIDLTVQRQDGKINSDDSDWLQAHLSQNESSRLNAEAIQESAVLYRAIAPAVVLAGMREEVLAKVEDVLGGNSSPGSDGGSSSGASGTGTGTGVGASGAALGSVAAFGAVTEDAEASDRRRETRSGLAAFITLVIILLLAGSAEESQPVVVDQTSEAVAPAPSTSTSAAKAEGTPRSNSSKKESSKPVQTSTNSQGQPAGSDKPVASKPKPSNSNGNSGGDKKSSSGGESNAPKAKDPEPAVTTPPAQEPAPAPVPPSTQPPPKKPPFTPLPLCSSNCTPPPQPIP